MQEIQPAQSISYDSSYYYPTPEQQQQIELPEEISAESLQQNMIEQPQEIGQIEETLVEESGLSEMGVIKKTEDLMKE